MLLKDCLVQTRTDLEKRWHSMSCITRRLVLFMIPSLQHSVVG